MKFIGIKLTNFLDLKFGVIILLLVGLSFLINLKLFLSFKNVGFSFKEK